MRDKVPGLPVIIMTAFSDLDSAVAAFQGGAFEYLAKPFDVDKAVELIRRAVDESMRGEQTWDDRVAEAPEMLGQAPAMQDMFRAIGRLSHSAATVLITGESGTGKELVARALHRHSPRANGPFIALNTAAIPKDLLESELFGHERGAFTGAQAMRQRPLRAGRERHAVPRRNRRHAVRSADASVARAVGRAVLSRRRAQPAAANVRVIAATHQNLESRVRQGLFREDLYHRLNVIRLRLPALRERSEDIPLLDAALPAKKRARSRRRAQARVGRGAALIWRAADFPAMCGSWKTSANWLTVMAPAQTIEQQGLAARSHADAGICRRRARRSTAAAARRSGDVASLPRGDQRHESARRRRSARQPAGVPVSVWENGLRTEVARLLRENTADVMDELARRFEAAVIREALDFTRGRKVEAAERLGIGRNTITRKIQELHLEP